MNLSQPEYPTLCENVRVDLAPKLLPSMDKTIASTFLIVDISRTFKN